MGYFIPGEDLLERKHRWVKWLLCPTLYWWNNLQCKLDSYHLSSGPVTLTNYSQTLVDPLLAGPARQGNPWPTHNTNISGVPNEHCHMVRHKRRQAPNRSPSFGCPPTRKRPSASNECRRWTNNLSDLFRKILHVLALWLRCQATWRLHSTWQRFMNGSALCAVVWIQQFGRFITMKNLSIDPIMMQQVFFQRPTIGKYLASTMRIAAEFYWQRLHSILLSKICCRNSCAGNASPGKSCQLWSLTSAVQSACGSPMTIVKILKLHVCWNLGAEFPSTLRPCDLGPQNAKFVLVAEIPAGFDLSSKSTAKFPSLSRMLPSRKTIRPSVSNHIAQCVVKVHELLGPPRSLLQIQTGDNCKATVTQQWPTTLWPGR